MATEMGQTAERHHDEIEAAQDHANRLEARTTQRKVKKPDPPRTSVERPILIIK